MLLPGINWIAGECRIKTIRSFRPDWQNNKIRRDVKYNISTELEGWVRESISIAIESL